MPAGSAASSGRQWEHLLAEGRIEYRGKDHRNLGNDFYQEIGVGFETPITFSKLTALENLAFFRKLYRRSGAPSASFCRRRTSVRRSLPLSVGHAS
jgi:ABC-type multidrug transport system ATPase subunit